MAFLAVDEEEVQDWCWGHHLARPDGSTMFYLHHLEVAEPFRGRGIGRGLLRSSMAAGVRLGAGRCS
ncbi:GNAT family N-acetyltransferase [Actinoplanes flavus]|uniref:GNAT family N-acetyltransferase n=1 Tax=Actinoplanes flavus TaxID=2820290 RepID=UPI003555CEC3